MWFVFFLVSVLFASPAFAANWYIAPGASDGNPCTEAAPCGTVRQAATHMSPGDTLYFRQGTYCEDVRRDTFIPNGTSDTNRTILTSYPGEQATFNCGGFNFYTVTTPIQYITVKKINLTNGASWSPLGCPVTGIRFEDSEISNNPSGSGVGGGGFPGCHPTDLEYINLHIHHNGLSDLDHGMYICSTNAIVRDNHVHDNSGYGIQWFESNGNHCGDGVKIYNNIIHDNRIYGGIVVGHSDNVQVYNNVIYNNGGAGIDYLYGNKNNGLIANNTIYGNGGNPISLGSTAACGGDPACKVTNAVVKNNIMFNNGQPGIAEAFLDSVTYGNNLCATLATGCTETGTADFVDAAAGNFQLQSTSDARNSGETLSQFSFDVVYSNRPLGSAWDIGAYEFPEGTTPTPPSGNPIYVAASGGTPTTDCIAAENQATPIRTIAGGLACMDTVPGKVMYIKAGTYTECIDTLTQPIRGGDGPSYTNATTIASYGTDLVTIRPTTCPTGVAFFLQNGTNDSYIVFRGSSTNRLVFDGTNIGNNFALYPNANHIRFEYVDFKNSASFEVLYGLNTSNIEIVDSLVHGAGTSGIAFDGTTANWLIERTEVYSNSGAAPSAGIRLKSGTSTGVTVKESTVKDNIGNGITLGAAAGTTLVNSLIYDNGGVGLLIPTGSSVTKIYNNTFYSNTGNGIQCDAGAATAEIRNTISFGNAINIVDNCTLTLQTNLTDNPLFVDPPTNLQLQATSTAINTGTTLASVVIDRAGTTRPQGIAYDIGAYDRDAVPVTPPPGQTGHNPRIALMLF